MKRKLLTFAVVAMLPLMMNAQQTFQLNDVRIDGVQTTTLCGLNGHLIMPIRFMFQATSVPNTCTGTYYNVIVTQPSGLQLPPQQFSGDGLKTVTAGDAIVGNGTYDPDILTGIYKVSLEYGCPSQTVELSQIPITVGDGVVGEYANTPGVANGDGSVTEEIQPYSINSISNVTHLSNGQTIGTGLINTSFLKTTDLVFEDNAGCVQSVPVAVLIPTGVPIAPLLNLVGSLNYVQQGRALTVVNPKQKVTYYVEHRLLPFLPWCSLGQVTSTTKVKYPGKYRVKAVNTKTPKAGISLSTEFEIKCPGNIPTVDNPTYQERVAASSNAKVTQVIIVDPNGKVVRESYALPIPTDDLKTPGLYFKTIYYDDYTTATDSFVIK